MSFHLTTIVKLPLNIFTVFHYHQLLPDIFQYVNNFLYLQCLEIEVHFSSSQAYKILRIDFIDQLHCNNSTVGRNNRSRISI